MSYSWDFLIGINFCATVVIVLNPPACFVRLVCIYCKVSESAILMFTSNYGTSSPSFYCLSNLEFNSLIHLGNLFNCLQLLMYIHSKI